MRKAKLIGLCEHQRGHVEARGLATKEEIARYWPEGGERASMEKWIYCWGHMVRFSGRQEFLRSGSDHAVAELLKVMADDPSEPIQLLSGEVVQVHPKSYWTLKWMDHNGRAIVFLGVRIDALQDTLDDFEKRKVHGQSNPLNGITQPFEVIENALAEVSHRYALQAWVACTPGPGMPWGYDVPDELPGMGDIPAMYLDLHPSEYGRIHSEFLKINMTRLRFLPKASSGGSGVTPDVFFATRARQFGGVDPRDLMMRKPLASQIASVTLSNPIEDRKR